MILVYHLVTEYHIPQNKIFESSFEKLSLSKRDTNMKINHTKTRIFKITFLA